MPRRKSKTNKRTLLQPRKGDRRYLRRYKRGEFKKEVNVGRSLSADRGRAAKTNVKKGQGATPPLKDCGTTKDRAQLCGKSEELLARGEPRTLATFAVPPGLKSGAVTAIVYRLST